MVTVIVARDFTPSLLGVLPTDRVDLKGDSGEVRALFCDSGVQETDALHDGCECDPVRSHERRPP
jgi:hypothetical protein